MVNHLKGCKINTRRCPMRKERNDKKENSRMHGEGEQVIVLGMVEYMCWSNCRYWSKEATYCRKVQKFCHEMKNNTPYEITTNRSESSINHRWYAFQKSVNKYCPAYAHIKNRAPSGAGVIEYICFVSYKVHMPYLLDVAFCSSCYSFASPTWRQHFTKKTEGKKCIMHHFSFKLNGQSKWSGLGNSLKTANAKNGSNSKEKTKCKKSGKC